MTQKIYQIDAFASNVFSGNPAAVCPLDHWLDEKIMQQIAMENNLAETAFYVKKDEHYELRWFTPTVEVDLCGHATLAAAYVLFNIAHHSEDYIRFYSPRSGELTVSKLDDFLTLDFPTDPIKEVKVTQELSDGFNITPLKAFKGKTDYMLIYENETQIRSIIPNFNLISKIDARGIIVTAKGDTADFVSRFFAPQSGVNEDPVTGSAHTTLTPYWAKTLGKNELAAIQLSKRQGHLQCTNANDRIKISGQAKLYMTGEIYI